MVPWEFWAAGAAYITCFRWGFADNNICVINLILLYTLKLKNTTGCGGRVFVDTGGSKKLVPCTPPLLGAKMARGTINAAKRARFRCLWHVHSCLAAGKGLNTKDAPIWARILCSAGTGVLVTFKH